MKKQLANKAIAVATITAMSAGLVACGGSGDAGNQVQRLSQMRMVILSTLAVWKS